MPFLDDPTPLNAPMGTRPAPEQSMLGDFWEKPQPVGFGAGFRAGFQLENPVAEVLRASYLDLNNDPEDGFNSAEYAKINGVEDMADQLLWTNNTKMADAYVIHTIKERDYKRTMAASGWGGTLGAVVGGIASPTTLLPGAGLVSAVRGGYAVGKSAAAIAASAGASVAMDEAILQSVQMERTADESAFNIAGGVLVGGLLGGAAASVLTKTEQELVERGWKAINENTGAAVGADKPNVWSRDDLSLSGVLARGIVNTMDFINPNVRLATSSSLVSREIGQQLFENTFYYNMHGKGVSGAAGGSAETYTNVLINSALNLGGQAQVAQFTAMKKAGTNMTYHDFDQAVAMAMRNNDAGENEFISNAAKARRDFTFDKMKDAAIKEGLLPPEVRIEEAASYFSRVYNKDMIVARDAEFKQIVKSWAEGMLEENFAKQKIKTNEKIGQLRADIEDLKLDGPGRLKALNEIDTKMAELANNYREGFDADQEIRRIRSEASKAKAEGDTARAETLRSEAKAMEKSAAEYRAAVGPVLRRRRVVERGTGAADAKIEKIQDQLVKLEEANLTTLRRLVNKGRWLERELGKAPTEQKLGELIEDLNETFNVVAKQFDAGFDRLAETNRKIDEEAAALKEKQGSAEGKTTLERAQDFNEYTKKLAPMQERIAKFQNAQAARRARLDRIAQRIEEAETIDPAEIQAVLKNMAEELVADISSMTLGRGERAARLLARMEKLDPEKVKLQMAHLEAKAKLFEDGFYTRWERNMLGDGVDLNGTGKPNLANAADELAEDYFNKVTGRHNQLNTVDAPEWQIAATRGPLKDRTMHIPDELIKDFLNNSADEVSQIMSRRIAGQIAMQWRFGNTTLAPQLKVVAEDYDKLQKLVNDAETYKDALNVIGKEFGTLAKIKETLKGTERSKEGLKLWLKKQEGNDIADLQAGRDLILGRANADANASVMGRSMRALNQINYQRMSGGFLLASLTEMYRGPMVQGLGRTLGILPSIISKNITADGTKINAAVVKEMNWAGLGANRFLHTRMSSLAELGDPFARGNAGERLLENMSKFASKWNGMAHFQDFNEFIVSHTIQNKLVEGLKDGTEKRWLAYLGIDESSGLARKMGKELEQHAENVDGVWIANTEKWTDQNAVIAFRNAFAKELRRTIVYPGYGDVPLMWQTPTGRMLTQFRSFMMASHQRLMITGLQESPLRFLSGLIGMTTIGMAAVTLRAMGRGQDSYEKFKKDAENPLFLLGEGLDMTGLLPIFFELSNMTEKATKTAGFSFNPIKSPLKAMYDGNFQVDSQKTWGMPLEQAILGPGVGFGTGLAKAAGVAGQALAGEGISKGEFRQSLKMIPFSSHAGPKEIIQLLNDDLPYMR